MQNNAYLDMHIYVVRSGQTRSLGMATGLSEATLTLPRQTVLSEIQILADPIGGSQSYVTPFLYAYPGDRIRVIIRNLLSLSTAWVEYLAVEDPAVEDPVEDPAVEDPVEPPPPN